MPIGTALAVYFLIWWVTLFAVLPWGARSQVEDGTITPGTDPGAPLVHRLWSKVLWTTMIATIVFGVLLGAYVRGFIPYDFLMRISGPPR